MKYHLKISIDYALNLPDERLSTLFQCGDRPMSYQEAKGHLLALRDLGHRYLCAAGEKACPDFDPFGNGCPGHEEESRYVKRDVSEYDNIPIQDAERLLEILFPQDEDYWG